TRSASTSSKRPRPATRCLLPSAPNLTPYASSRRSPRKTSHDISNAKGQSMNKNPMFRRRLFGVSCAVALAATLFGTVFVAPGSATPPTGGFTNTALARGTDVSRASLPLQVGTDVAMAQINVDPGGSSGWHSHPGGAIIVVQSGSLTLYKAI